MNGAFLISPVFYLVVSPCDTAVVVAVVVVDGDEKATDFETAGRAMAQTPTILLWARLNSASFLATHWKVILAFGYPYGLHILVGRSRAFVELIKPEHWAKICMLATNASI